MRCEELQFPKFTKFQIYEVIKAYEACENEVHRSKEDTSFAELKRLRRSHETDRGVDGALFAIARRENAFF